MARFLRDRYFWYLVALTVALGIIIYGDYIAFPGWLAAHKEWHLTYMVIGHLVFLVGVVIAAWRFGIKGGLVASAALGLIIVPHSIEMVVDLGMVDELLETGIFIAVGIALSWLIGTRKRAEEVLRESEELHRLTLSNISDAVFITDDTGEFTYICPNVDVIFGYSFPEVQAFGNIAKLLSDDLFARNQLETLGEIRNIDREITDKAGRGHALLINVKRVSVRGGTTLYTCRDITKRKRAEEREKQLQAELALSSRLAAIGELAAGVAHEINNPLTGIIGFSQLLMRKSTDEKVRRDLEIIHHEGLRAAKIVENLLTFARRRESEKEYADTNDILKKALDLRAYELKTSNIEVALDLAPSLPKVMVDFHQIQEVFLNVILNAEQAMTEANHGGKLSIKTQATEGYIRISFADDGPGVSSEHLNKLFDPFFTTRGDRGGTGLGLSICHGIVTEHSGRIYVKSKPGEGATFFVDLPLSTEKIGKNKFVK